MAMPTVQHEAAYPVVLDLVVVDLLHVLELLLLLLPEVHVLLGLLAGSERTAGIADRT